MSTLRKRDRVAVLCSDLHLSLLKPNCRAEKDWMAVQEFYLAQLKQIAGGLPVICAGDIFDKWNVQPELINFALKHLPDRMICVPGQHDLPNHQLTQIYRSGYGVLMQAGKIIDLSGVNKTVLPNADVAVSGFAWGVDIKPCERDYNSSSIQLAVIHRYCWTQGATYPGAPSEGHVNSFRKELRGYDAAVFGDNHKGFEGRIGRCNIINTGTFIRRKSDEKDYRPRVGILYSDGAIKTKFLQTSDEFWDEEKEREEMPIDMQNFIKGLEELGEHGLNFRQAVDDYLKENHQELSRKTVEIILAAIEHE